jgi:hypothetical protein
MLLFLPNLVDLFFLIFGTRKIKDGSLNLGCGEDHLLYRHVGSARSLGGAVVFFGVFF